MLRKREIARFYLNNLKELVLPFQHPDTLSSWHLFVIQTENRKSFQKLIEAEIQTQVHYIPVNSQPFYDRERLNNSELLYKNCLSIPIYVDLTKEELEKVVNNLRHD